jgi:hypothetical protein
MLLVHGIMDSSHAWVAGGAASGLGFRHVTDHSCICMPLPLLRARLETKPLVSHFSFPIRQRVILESNDLTGALTRDMTCGC